MRGILKFTAATIALIPAPLVARSPTSEVIEVGNAAYNFFEAVNSDDKAALAEHMMPEGVIFVHNRMTPNAPRVDIVPVKDHLARWANSTTDVEEISFIDTVLVDGDMAQVWGPYYFNVAGKLSHCGINSLSMVRTTSGWKVANTSFTMEHPDNCDAIVIEVNTNLEFLR